MTCQVEPCAAAMTKLSCTELRNLPRYAAETLDLHNRLHRRYAPWRTALGGEPLTVTWGAGSATGADAVVVAMTLGDKALQLSAPARLLELSDWNGDSARGVLSDTDAMLLELAWLSWIEPLEAALGEPLRVSGSVRDSASYPVAVSLQVGVGERPPLDVTLHMHTDLAERVVDWLARFGAASPDPLNALRLRLAVEAAEAPLTLGELHSLEPGDVVMLDSLADEQYVLRLGNRFVFRARRKAGGLECVAPLAAISPDALNSAALNLNRKFSMSDTDARTPAASDQDASLDDLPLTLICQIGSVELSLAELREMGPGSLLQLTSAAQDGVDLMVNGRRIGRGELVTIGDGLGVRLTGFTAP